MKEIWEGENRIIVKLNNLNSGMHLLSLEASKGELPKKW